MAVNRVPVLKECRALDLDPVYLGIDKKSHRNTKRNNKKTSEYGLQLREKQKAKFMVGETLMVLLETRLDNVLFRAGLGRTRRETRQIVDHREVLVNGKCVNIPSYLVKAGDVIEIKEAAKDSQRFKDIVETTQGRGVAAWLQSDLEARKVTVLQLPTREMIDIPVNEMLIVELYSK